MSIRFVQTMSLLNYFKKSPAASAAPAPGIADGGASESPVARVGGGSGNKDRPMSFQIGTRLRVYWSVEDKWSPVGEIDDFSADIGKYGILYDDGDYEWLDLAKERTELVATPSKAPASSGGENLKLEIEAIPMRGISASPFESFQSAAPGEKRKLPVSKGSKSSAKRQKSPGKMISKSNTSSKRDVAERQAPPSRTIYRAAPSSSVGRRKDRSARLIAKRHRARSAVESRSGCSTTTSAPRSPRRSP